MCGQPAGTPPGPRLASPRPALPTATPAAAERRPGGRRGVGLEGRKVSGGRARRAPGCRVGGGSAGELAGGCAAARARRAGTGSEVCAGPEGFGGAERTGSLRPRGDPGAGASPPGAGGAGGAGSRGRARGTRSARRGVAFLGRSESLGPAGASCPREGPSGALAGFTPRCPGSRSRSPLPLSSPPGSGNLFCDFAVVLLGILLGQARLLGAGQPSRKEKQVGH